MVGGNQATLDMSAVVQALQGIQISRRLIQHLIDIYQLLELIENTEGNALLLEVGEHHHKTKERAAQASNITNDEHVTRLKALQNLGQNRPIYEGEHPRARFLKDPLTTRRDKCRILLCQICILAQRSLSACVADE